MNYLIITRLFSYEHDSNISHIGPLTYTSGGQTYIVGVVSWGLGCARRNKPGVYARVTKALRWINGRIKETCRSR